MNDHVIAHTPAQLDSLRKLTHVLYALYAFAWLSCGMSGVIALIINYIKRQDVVGTLYESHFRWQIRTFWWSLFWGGVGWLLVFVLVGFAILGVLSIWVIYRIAKGWLYLNDGRPVGLLPVMPYSHEQRY